jgi:hypothetical protein
MVLAKEMKKVAVFLGDFFWSSIPYDGIRLLESLQNLNIDVDLLMFDKDIRLNKIFTGIEKYQFDSNIFKLKTNLKTIKNWSEFYSASKDYSLILTSTHIAPKTRYPHELKNNKHCPIAVWDIGGGDILTNAIHFSDIYFTKGAIWKEWLQKEKNISGKNIYVAGTPHYEEYILKEFKIEDFYKKYNILSEQKLILVCPTNPASHVSQFEQNLKELETIFSIIGSSKQDFRVLIKTYPNDYLFYEDDAQYSGVYKRVYGTKPQYEFLKNKFPDAIIIESQDHFSAVMNCDVLFNMSGSHISWETHFSKAKSYSINLEDKPYYKGVHYLKNVVYPDDLYNQSIKSVEEIFEFTINDRIKNDNFIFASNASQQIASIVNNILNQI